MPFRSWSAWKSHVLPGVSFERSYCNRVPSPLLGLGSSGGITVALATLSSVSRSRRRNAGGAAAGGCGPLGVDADDLAELADDHHLGGVVDEVDAGDLADFAGGLHVDDALAAAGLEAVGVDVGALAVAVLGDGEDEAGG